MTDIDGRSPDAGAVEGLSEEQAAADAGDLQVSLGELASLVIGGEGLSDVLAHVATFAVRAIPGAAGAGVTLLMVDRPDNMVQVLAASHPFVADIDEIQYTALHEGPCITAALERRTVRSGSLGGEKMWPRFGPRVGRLGIHSALSLPLLLSDRVLGAINVYARAKDAFDGVGLQRVPDRGDLVVPARQAAGRQQHLGGATGGAPGPPWPPRPGATAGQSQRPDVRVPTDAACPSRPDRTASPSARTARLRPRPAPASRRLVPFTRPSLASARSGRKGRLVLGD